MNEKIIICGAGRYGQNYMRIIGKEDILYFVDKNEELQKKGIEGIEVKNYDFLIKNYNSDTKIIIAAREPWNTEIANFLVENDVVFYQDIESYFLDEKKADWSKFKDLYKGESCFLIGSGPSLRVSDLEMLKKKGIVTFASNKIFKIFDKTDWRPDYYVVTDRRIINHYQDIISNLELDNKFIAYYHNEDLGGFYTKLKKKGFVLLKMKEDLRDEPYYEFSTSVDDYVIEGRTVMYAMMQLAVFMGFKTLYLIGVDFSYTDPTGYDKNNNDHFCNNYIEEGETVLITPKEYALKAFRSGFEFCKNNNIIIKNATRGGLLEVYDRVDLNDFFMGERL